MLSTGKAAFAKGSIDILSFRFTSVRMEIPIDMSVTFLKVCQARRGKNSRGEMKVGFSL